MKRHHLSTLVLLAGSLPLAACGNTPGDEAARDAERAVAVLGVELTEVEREVREELATGNIDFGGNHHTGDDRSNDSDAEITPEGDLLIDGKPITVDARERELLLDYRERITQVALAGTRIGMQGAQYGVATAIGLFKSLISFVFIVTSYALASKFANYRIF